MDKTNLILNSTIELVDVQEEGNGKGRPFVSRFIEPGIAHYKELGDILITKETLNKFINTMVGCPVIIEHEDVTDANADKLRVGVVSRVWFNELDGYFYCEGILTDPEAIDLVKNQGYNVSCAYSFVSDNTKKTHNGKEIDMEFIDGEFLHLALVKDPRYEGANIVVNSNIKNENDERERVPAGVPEGGQYTSLKYPDCTISPLYDMAKNDIEEAKQSKDDRKIPENIENQFNVLNKKYPNNVLLIKELKAENFGKNDEGETVTIGDESVIYINSDATKNPKMDKKWMISKNITNPQYILTHEFAHAISNSLPHSFFDEIDELREEYIKNEFSVDDKDFITYYATTKAPEFFAECFAYNELNNQENKYVKKAMEIYNKYTEVKNSIGDITMQVLNELKDFIKSVVSNEKDEEMKEVKNEDKRKLIDEVGGILKGKVDEEIWRTVIGKLEKIAYEPSEDDKADNEDDKKEAKNKCKNEDDETEKKEDVTKNEDKPEDDGEDEEEDKPEDKAENKKVKNSMRDMVMGGSSNVQEQKLYISRKERLEEGNKY